MQTTKNVIIDLPLAHLHAVSLFVANQDVRYYLNGVCIDQGHIVATNGHYMAAMPLGTKYDDIQIIIPDESIKAFLKQFTPKQKRLLTSSEIEYATETNAKNKDAILAGTKNKIPYDLTATISFDTETKNGVITCKDKIVYFSAIDGRFPNFKTVIPKTDDTEYHGFYNWDYMTLFSKASKILGGGSFGAAWLKENGKDAAKVVIPHCEEFIGVIMPMRY